MDTLMIMIPLTITKKMLPQIFRLENIYGSPPPPPRDERLFQGPAQHRGIPPPLTKYPSAASANSTQHLCYKYIFTGSLNRILTHFQDYTYIHVRTD